MHTEFRKATLPADLRSLVAFDHKVFRPADWFNAEDWRHYQCWWMVVDGRRIGCCAFERHVDFQEDIREDGANPPLRGSLYIVSTGILPQFRGQGFGNLLKSWQLTYARRRGFTRIVTNTRKSNKAMIALNKKFDFKIIRASSGYYRDPAESTVVMERCL